MQRHIRPIEAARHLATRIEAQRSVPDQLTAKYGPPSLWTSHGGTNYEWVIPETTVERMDPATLGRLKALGCQVFNVDTSREPYYFVCVRYLDADDDREYLEDAEDQSYEPSGP